MKARYVNPFTDFGFKKIFGEEASKPQLLDFLNSLLPKAHITDLSFKDKEKQGNNDEERKVIFDIYCDTNKGEKIIVELQKAKQNYFKDRTVFYSTFPIQEQAERGQWNYELKAVYCIGILDFKFNDYTEIPPKEEVIHTVELKDQNNKIFYKKLRFVYLEMPHFLKKENELETRLDKWLYFIKHLEDFQDIPTMFSDEIFTEAFRKAEIANYNQDERYDYEQSLKIYRDWKSVTDTAIQDGIDKGLKAAVEIAVGIAVKEAVENAVKEAVENAIDEKIIELAKQFKLNGISIDIIAKSTGLTEDEIRKL
jgi:predicted transposase/invertase (TIGR01784 family)